MKFLLTVFAICCWQTAQARPGYEEHGDQISLQGVPDLEAYSKISYPKFDIIDLGEYSKGHLPPTTIHSSKHVTIKVPEPYPVKVPHGVPVPVPYAKPYPVVQTKIVQVPHPVPYEVVKKVPYPVEVPKPYPVPTNEHYGGGSDSGGSYGGSYGGEQGHQQISSSQDNYESHSSQDVSQSYGDSYGAAEAGHQQVAASYGVPGQEAGTPLGASSYQNSYETSGYHGEEGGGGDHAAAQSQGWVAVAPNQQQNGNEGSH